MAVVPFRVRIALIALLAIIMAYIFRGQQIDDALIYARYIHNALQGKGLVFNAGEHVNALTSPLYAYIVFAAAWLLHGNVLLATTILSGIFLLLTCLLAERMAPYAGLFIASTGFFYSLVGMESALFLFFLLLLITLYQERRFNWLPLTMVLLVLTRAEGAALAATVCYELFRSRRFSTGRMPRPLSLLPAAAVAFVYALLNHHWFGSYLPASAGAKLGQGRSGLWGTWPKAFLGCAYQLKPDFLPILYVVALVGVLALLGLRRQWKSDFNRLALPFLIVLFSFYVLFNIPGYRWYFAPFIAFAMVYAGFGLAQFEPRQWMVLPVLAASAITSAAIVVRQPPLDHTTGYLGVSAWLNRNTPSSARVEAGEIGTLGFYSDRYLMDSLGLTLPKNADHIAHRDVTSWLREDRPDYVVVHRGDWLFENIAKRSSDYEPVPVDFGPVVYVLRRKSQAFPVPRLAPSPRE